jgi:hypothetical protein
MGRLGAEDGGVLFIGLRQPARTMQGQREAERFVPSAA